MTPWWWLLLVIILIFLIIYFFLVTFILIEVVSSKLPNKTLSSVLFFMNIFAALIVIVMFIYFFIRPDPQDLVKPENIIYTNDLGFDNQTIVRSETVMSTGTSTGLESIEPARKKKLLSAEEIF